MNSRHFIFLAALALLGPGLAGSLAAADLGGGIAPFSAASGGGEIVTSLSVTGAVSVSPEDVLAVVRQRKGEPLNDEVTNDDLKRIWKLGKFQDVSLDTEPGPGGRGVEVIYRVVERPTVQDVRFFGNKQISDGTLKDKAAININDPYDQDKVAAAVRAIQSEYKDKNFYAAQVSVDTQPGTKPGYVVVNFRVSEGNKMQIEQINVTGNQVFSADKIRGAMKDTQVAGWFTGGSYDPDKVFDDYQNVLKLYAKEGYVKARIDGVSLDAWGDQGRDVVRNSTTFDEANKRIELTLKVSEGPQYHLGTVTFAGNTVFTDAQLKAAMLSMHSKDHVFNQDDWNTDLETLRTMYSSKGYVYASIEPDYTWDNDNATVSAKLTVQESTIAYIEEIRIRGNEVTKDHVIRRVLILKPGDPFNSEAVNADRARINNLGYFEQVTVDTQPGSEMDKLILIFDVSERKTGTLSVGAGYSSVEGLVGFLQVSQNNLFGNGQSVSAQWNFGSETNSYSLSFTEPWLFDKPVSLGVDLFSTMENSAYNTQGFNLQSTGGALRTGYSFLGTPYKVTGSYRYQTDNITDVQGSIVGIEPGITHLSVITPGLSRDTRDNIFSPSTGSLNALSMEVAGGYLGGDDAFVKPVFDSRYFFDTPALFGQDWMRKFVLGLHGRVGWAVTYSDGTGVSDVPTSERFFMGGTDTVRGYDERSLGASGIGGGTYELLTNVEYGFKPIPPVELHIFYDSGNSWNSPYNTSGVTPGESQAELPGNAGSGGINIYNPANGSWNFRDLYLYPSAGVGLLFTIPTSVIQIRLDWGYALDPVARSEGDVEGGRVHFNIGNIF
ncbi:MAG TPA: outer membrane protein assembly factor BamA [bacterium]|nr:outer membrane protein assembly factor BamA [bacterium]